MVEASNAQSSPRRPAKKTPHYALRTIAHSAPEYANKEQDLIRQSFTRGNHTWMKESLPVELGPDAINMLRRQRMERNRLAEPLPQTWSKMAGQAGAKTGHEFEYIPEEADRHFERRREQRLKHLEKREKIANHDWRHSSQEVKLKHEPLIKDGRTKEVFPYLGGDQDLELPTGKHFYRMHLPLQSWQEEIHAPKAGSFLTGKPRDLPNESGESRMSLPIIVQRLQRRLTEDWEGSTVVVNITDGDLVQIAFDLDTVDSERGIMAYMNVLSKDTELLGALGLRKVSQLWGMKREFTTDDQQQLGKGDSGTSSRAEDDGANSSWVFFLLIPKWVRMRPTDAFYTVHPRAKGSAFRMSSAGSSVLMSLGSSVTERSSEKKSAERKGGVESGSSSARGARSPAKGTAGMGQGPQSAREAKEQKVDLMVIEKAVSGIYVQEQPQP